MKIGFYVCLWVTVAAAPVTAQELVAAKDGTVRVTDARALLAASGETYLATKYEVFRACAGQGKWDAVFALPPGENEITCLGGSARTVFAGTRRGLYRTDDFGRTWRVVFKAIIPEKNEVWCIETGSLGNGMVLIGTGRGVFESRDAGESWRDASGALKAQAVRCVARAGSALYACAENGLYRKASDAVAWERVYIRSVPETDANEPDTDEQAPEPDEADDAGRVRRVTCIAAQGACLYVGLDTGILRSDDGGRSWSAFPCQGLAGIVNCIRPSSVPQRVYCATTRGAFLFDPQGAEGKGAGWRELYKGTDKVLDVRALVSGDEKESYMWAMANRGLYRLEWRPADAGPKQDVEARERTYRIVCDNEPTLRALQRAAMKFADVEPEKIRDWHTQSRLKALVPKISIGVDHGTSTNAELYTSATTRYVFEGPADLDDGWDVSVSWELGDLIWSSDQTSIDVRSRLTTQLRNDILDDLRRIYFERKRLRYEMMVMPPQDPRLAFEKELRIQELTQALDDISGNYFSDHLKDSSCEAGVALGSKK